MKESSNQKPNVLIKGSLKLSLEKESKLVDKVIERFEASRKDLGYSANTEDSLYTLGSILQKKWEYQNMYEGYFDFRTAKDELFASYNGTLNIPQRAIRVFKATTSDKLLNIEPLVTISPEGDEDVANDPNGALKIADDYFNLVLKEAKLKDVLRKGLEGACVVGDRIVKIVPKAEEVSELKEVRIVMVGGEPLKDTSGRFILEEDEWEATAEDPEELGMMQLKKDPNIVVSGELEFSEVMTLPSQNIRHGVDFVLLPWEDCYYPSTARSIQSDDFFHVYDLDVDDLLSRADKTKLSPHARQWLDQMRSSNSPADTLAKSDSDKPFLERGENPRTEGEGVKRTQILEAWLKIDADGDGYAEDLHITIALDGNIPIYYDYLQKASVTGKKPFVRIPCLEIENRITGMGFYELLKNQHDFVDREFNRLDASHSNSGGIRWMAKDCFEEVEYGMPIQTNSNQIYTLKKQWAETGLAPMGEFRSQTNLQDVWALMEKQIQSAMLIAGTLTPSDGEFSGLPANDTYGGMQLQASESNTLNNDMLQDIIESFIEIMEQAAMILFGKYFDQNKVADLMDEQSAQILADWVSAGEVRNIFRRMKMSMSKDEDRQQLMANQQVMTQVIPVWEQLMPEQKMRWKPVFASTLKSLKVQNPDKILGNPEEELLAQQEAMAQEQALLNQQNGQPTTTQTAPQEPLEGGGGEAAQVAYPLSGAQ